MSYVLFLDESGHDHKTMPYEVRGGVCLHAKKLWPFVLGMRALEEASFGALLSTFGREIKGHRLLDKDRFAWAQQAAPMDDLARRKHTLSFLLKGARNEPTRTREEFTAYGQGCLNLARGMFDLLRAHDAKIFAVAIPRNVKKPVAHEGKEADDFLRKDHVFLLERYYYFLERANESGLVVLDETDKADDRRLVRRLERYFTRTQTGRYRAARIVPSPFFVASDMTYPVQAADLCIYCINWGYRLPKRGMDAPVREDIAGEFAPLIEQLVYEGQGYREGRTFPTYGIEFVPDPYTARDQAEKNKEATQSGQSR